MWQSLIEIWKEHLREESLWTKISFVFFAVFFFLANWYLSKKMLHELVDLPGLIKGGNVIENGLAMVFATLSGSSIAVILLRIIESHKAAHYASKWIMECQDDLARLVVAGANVSESVRNLLSTLVAGLRGNDTPERIRAHVALGRLKLFYDDGGEKKPEFHIHRHKNDFFLPNVQPDELTKKMEKQIARDFEWILDSVKYSWDVVAYEDLSQIFGNKGSYIKRISVVPAAIKIQRLVLFPTRKIANEVLPSVIDALNSDAASAVSANLREALSELIMQENGRFYVAPAEFAEATFPKIDGFASCVGINEKGKKAEVCRFLKDLIHLCWLAALHTNVKRLNDSCRIINPNSMKHFGQIEIEVDATRKKKIGEVYEENDLFVFLLGNSQQPSNPYEGAALLDREVSVRVDHHPERISYTFSKDSDVSDKFKGAINHIFQQNNPKSYPANQLGEFLASLVNDQYFYEAICPSVKSQEFVKYFKK